jgi:hypothetical protein
MNDDLDAVHLGVIGQNPQRVGKHRLAGKWEILLGNIALTAQALAPAARHNYRYRRCHCHSSRDLYEFCLDGRPAPGNVGRSCSRLRNK